MVQPVLSAGDVQRIVLWGHVLDSARGLDPSERALLTQLEGSLHPQVFVPVLERVASED